jgi:hypothetical protein
MDGERGDQDPGWPAAEQCSPALVARVAGEIAARGHEERDALLLNLLTAAWPEPHCQRQ